VRKHTICNLIHFGGTSRNPCPRHRYKALCWLLLRPWKMLPGLHRSRQQNSCTIEAMAAPTLDCAIQRRTGKTALPLTKRPGNVLETSPSLAVTSISSPVVVVVARSFLFCFLFCIGQAPGGRSQHEHEAQSSPTSRQFLFPRNRDFGCNPARLRHFEAEKNPHMVSKFQEFKCLCMSRKSLPLYFKHWDAVSIGHTA
jgi:hypothetical protein